MNIEELFAGIGVVIDDKVFATDENEDRIVKIIRELEDVHHFPLVKYADFPSEECGCWLAQHVARQDLP